MSQVINNAEALRISGRGRLAPVRDKVLCEILEYNKNCNLFFVQLWIESRTIILNLWATYNLYVNDYCRTFYGQIQFWFTFIIINLWRQFFTKKFILNFFILCLSKNSIFLFLETVFTRFGEIKKSISWWILWFFLLHWFSFWKRCYITSDDIQFWRYLESPRASQ